MLATYPMQRKAAFTSLSGIITFVLHGCYLGRHPAAAAAAH
jgi:hypothetical protein